MISVVIVSYNDGPVLARCLDSLEGDDGLEVIVVNNGDESEALRAAAALPFVTVVEAGGNIGFAAGSNLGARRAVGDVLVFLNSDTVVAPGALRELAATLDDSTVGIAMARLRLLGRPELLNSGGNVLHVSGLAWAGGYGEPADQIEAPREVTYPSGAAMAIRADLFRELGGFTEELFLYHEDLELGWRARLRGLRIVLNPEADVYHDYEYGRTPDKSYFLERNRLVFVLSAYSGRLLCLLAPVLISTELAMVTLAAREGWLRAKVAGWGWCARNAGWLAQHRRETQRLRRVPDRALAPLLTAVLDPAMIPIPRALRGANPLVAGYWSLAKRML